MIVSRIKIPRSRSKRRPPTKKNPEANFDFAAESWNWPVMAICTQKLVRHDKFDPDETYFARGAHMPLMVFIGEKGRTRRSHEGQRRRATNAAKRGYPRERIEAIKRDEVWKGYGRGAQTSWEEREEIPRNDWACGRSSSSNQAANDPSRTAWQNKRAWNPGWSSNNNWGWKQ